MRKAEIIAFPASTAPPSTIPAILADTPPQPRLARSVMDIDLAEIAHRLGLDRLQPATIVQHLRALAIGKGFPLPRTTRFWRRQEVTGPRLIVSSAIWNRYEVDQWFENRDPPTLRMARQRHRRELLREEMAGRAIAAATTRRIAARA